VSRLQCADWFARRACLQLSLSAILEEDSKQFSLLKSGNLTKKQERSQGELLEAHVHCQSQS